MAVILFLSSGRISWLGAWIAIGLMAIFHLFVAWTIIPRNPNLTDKAGIKTWDKPLYPLIALYIPICTWVVAGLDNRFGWSSGLSGSVMIASLLIMISGIMLSVWAMLSNKFYTGIATIQTHKGHEVAVDGPYKYVRHPSYAGAILLYLSLPVLLGSLWALIPNGIAALLILVRTILEDKMLRSELEGYNSYACRVKYYLIPGIW